MIKLVISLCLFILLESNCMAASDFFSKFTPINDVVISKIFEGMVMSLPEDSKGILHNVSSNSARDYIDAVEIHLCPGRMFLVRGKKAPFLFSGKNGYWIFELRGDIVCVADLGNNVVDIKIKKSGHIYKDFESVYIIGSGTSKRKISWVFDNDKYVDASTIQGKRIK